MNPNHPLSAATAAALAAGHAPLHVPAEAHQSVQGIPTPAMSSSGGIPGAGPGGVGAAGGAVGLPIPRSVGAGMMGAGSVGPNDQRGIPGQPGAGGVHPMGAAAHPNPHTQAMLQAQAQAQAQAVQGHAMGPSMNPEEESNSFRDLMHMVRALKTTPLSRQGAGAKWNSISEFPYSTSSVGKASKFLSNGF
ncbi:hypothetical protein KEM54_005906 [Ascosphaera aggregata]|nr:hypothetical protein KEM54_005906 [Ascosphaera aggregata]